MRRVVTPELLDVDAGTPLEVEKSLADLRTINRYFGGVRTTSTLIAEVAQRRQLKKISLLDVGAATGDVPAMSSESLSLRGVELQPVLLDRVAAHLNGNYAAVAGDALALPFQNGSFDVVASSLFVHHLEPPQVIQFFNEALRVARHAVLINDLIRHPLHVALVYAGFAFYRSRLTRHDSVVSVKRAYTIDEIMNMLRQTTAFEVTVRRFFLFRMGVIAWKRPSTT